jgi:hydrogenase-4 component E
VSAAVPIPVIQLLQVLTVALGAPGITGVIGRVEARLQGRRGPRVLLSPASAVLASIGLAAFGFFTFGGLRGVVPPGQQSGAFHIHGPAAPTPALAIAGAMVFVAFGLMIVRRDVASQAVGFFSLENAISLAALVVAAGLPLIFETAFLFDLLVAVVVFGMLMRAHHARADSLSTADLSRLRG